jgi:hypothetical protein
MSSMLKPVERFGAAAAADVDDDVDGGVDCGCEIFTIDGGM